ncbi:hypothetical protein JAAARDRAFT_134659 [Jaapia argillacea MUCL 33604]|uniref:Dienelactone hydrolase domain-containing protein n=1 Tax=Jaapia argillacea MUCL 33604 TaxID=933084 RepID=A0A067PJ41_9AGAM|nr:hypothetical protein JAAARDRAFT_134659 [Jaapia argillacea MUCL 33604]
MSTHVHNDNVACCTIPPVKSDYSPKGTFKAYGGFDKVYVTGPAKSEMTLVAVYDIFGFKPQTQQGADIIASSLNVTVLMPDFFHGEEWPASKYPPKDDKEKRELQEFFGGPANPSNSVTGLIQVAKSLKSDGVKAVGAFGFCWGGKVTILAGSQTSTPLDAVAAVHPAMLSSSDVNSLEVPLGLYPSKDEPIEEYNRMLEIVAKKPFASKNDHKLYKNMFHGFAAARANLDEPENKKAFEDLYATLIKYFKNALA